ncbi:hypothetical protein MUK42_11823 [Musa troglodytarum]|uniref:Uncharacterized protein n=1 Tax=Musa troglodytarum TaxID=320322 RepID=A0A9E7KUT3_9LILI|nr:hypothetical protein MUK42_11823 [Musa troglodytarum]
MNSGESIGEETGLLNRGEIDVNTTNITRGLFKQKKRTEIIAQSQRELLEARAKVEEAQRSLSANTDDSNNSDIVFEDINKEKERLESAKAAVVSSVAGTLASVPIYLYQATSVPQLILDLAVISISCALFGVTFRCGLSVTDLAGFA